MADRFHRAARDGMLDLLKEATRKDCNSRDDDGMTPTLWCVFEGNMEALRLVVGRGGDVEKCDNFGNTALHFAAARGHTNCVSFLLQYGVNIYAKDIDHHTAKDLAAMKNHGDILRCLDERVAQDMRKNAKKVQALMEKADREADKRVKDYSHMQEKARKLAEKEKKRLDKDRQRMEKFSSSSTTTAIPRASMSAMTLRKDSRVLYGQSPKFSDLVNQNRDTNKIKMPISAVYKKVQQQRKKLMNKEESIQSATNPSTDSNEPGDFKVGAIENGKRSVRSISGLKRNSEVMYVTNTKYDGTNEKTGLNEIFCDKLSIGRNGGSMARNQSQPDILNYNEEYGDEKAAVHRGSIFERPGFGGLAFRHSLTALVDKTKPETPIEDSIGSAGSLQNRKPAWNDDDDLESDEDDDEENQATPMYFFLTAVGLEEFIEPFVKEKFDLDSLMLVKESDLVAMNIPRGYRLKLMRAIAERQAAMSEPGELEDCHL